MADTVDVGPILAVDVGNTRTKAVLLDAVEGRHRFVACADAATTLRPPFDDVSLGAREAIAGVESVSGRVLLASNGPLLPQRDNGSGVDCFVSTTSVGGPLRLLLVALSPASGVHTMLRESGGYDALTVETVLFDGEAGNVGGRNRVSRGERAQKRKKPRGEDMPAAPSGAVHTLVDRVLHALEASQPHAIVIAGGAADPETSGLLELGNALAKDVTSPRPSILLVASIREGELLRRVLDGKYEMRLLALGEGAIEVDRLLLWDEIRRFWRHGIVEGTPGYSLVRSWESEPVCHSAIGFGRVVRFLAKHHTAPTWGIDFGASYTRVFSANGNTSFAVSSVAGTGRGSINLLKSVWALRGRLPFELTGEEIEAVILNKWARPWTVPETREELRLDAALATQAAREAMDGVGAAVYFPAEPRPGLVVATGGLLAGGTSPAQMALAIMDALEPTGITELAVDTLSILPALGAVASSHPQAAAEALLSDGLTWLGTCIAGRGPARLGEKAVVLEIKRSGQRPTKIDIPCGGLKLIPLARQDTIELSIKPNSNLDFGWGRGRSGKISVRGGKLGLVVDARETPLVPVGAEGRWSRVREWLEGMGA
ncbi:MAG: glutamate mutase L [Chloroflexi bacterium]|nr:glutamate mutase L [Chloroflexota bacterium]